MSTPTQKVYPPRIIVDDNLETTQSVEDLESENGIKIPEKYHYLHWSEHDDLLRQARAEVYLEEVTYWMGEHRHYLEAGMIWESELSMKQARRYGELAKAEAERKGR